MKIFKLIGIVILATILFIGSLLGLSILTGKFDKGTGATFSGSSMVDRGFPEEESEYNIYGILDKCDVGENCAFTCLVDKCINGDNRRFGKNLTKKDGDCYWFEGNEDRTTSWDSRWYGWLCGDELQIEGVIK